MTLWKGNVVFWVGGRRCARDQKTWNMEHRPGSGVRSAECTSTTTWLFTPLHPPPCLLLIITDLNPRTSSHSVHKRARPVYKSAKDYCALALHWEAAEHFTVSWTVSRQADSPQLWPVLATSSLLFNVFERSWSPRADHGATSFLAICWRAGECAENAADLPGPARQPRLRTPHLFMVQSEAIITNNNLRSRVSSQLPASGYWLLHLRYAHSAPAHAPATRTGEGKP